MDEVLSVFIAKTSCDPGVARDILNHHNGNLGQALKTYYRMKDIIIDGDEDDDDNDQSTNINTTDSSYNSYPRTSALKEDVSSTLSTTSNSKELTSQLLAISNKCSSEPSLSSVLASSSSDVCDGGSSLLGGANLGVLTSPSKLTSFHNFPRGSGRAGTIGGVGGNSGGEVAFLEKKLSRGISRAADNVNLVSKARSEFAADFQVSSRGSRLLNVDGFLETPDFTFTLPDINVHQPEFSDFLRRDLIEKSTLLSLESSKRLNWWSDIAQNLYPLVTSGDGNCLLHAASLGMWGFHDRGLTLRRAMYMLLSKSPYTPLFYRRWRWQTHFQNMKLGLTFTEMEWKVEWENILRMASTEPRSKKYGDDLGGGSSTFELSGGKKEPNEYEEKAYIYESLEEIHIFVLAHVLRRPIIIIADTMLKDLKGEAFFPIPFGGIYLPFECSDHLGGLKKSPLCLTYDAAHFSALVAMKKETVDAAENPNAELPFAIPLMDVDHNVLPLHFAIDPGEDVFAAAAKAASSAAASSAQSNAQSTTTVETMFDNLAKSFVLTEQDKIELLKKYFDIVSFSHLKANCVATSTSPTTQQQPSPTKNLSPLKATTSKLVAEKSQTLPSNFGRKASDFSEVQALIAHSESGKDAVDGKAKTLSRKSSAKAMLQKPFVTFGRMSKRIKKNIGQLARRSASFRIGKTPPHGTSTSNTTTSANTQPDSSAPASSSTSSETLPPPPAPTSSTDNESCPSSASTSSESPYTESIINTDNSVFYCDTNVLAAKLAVNKQHSYYDDMIRNYLNTARVRFFNEKRAKKLKDAQAAASAGATNTSVSTLASTTSSTSSSSSSSSSSSNSAPSNSSSLSLEATTANGATITSTATTTANSTTNSNSTTTTSSSSFGAHQIRCVAGGTDCSSPASAATNFLCVRCFEEQKKTMLERNYGAKVNSTSTCTSAAVPRVRVEGPPPSPTPPPVEKLIGKGAILAADDPSSEKLKSLYSPESSPLLKERKMVNPLMVNPLSSHHQAQQHREYCIPSSL